MDAAVSLCTSPRPPPPTSRSLTSARVRQTSVFMASISVYISASMACTIWKLPMGLPNCTRVLAYSTLNSSARSQMPTHKPATSARSRSSPLMTILTPSFSLPTRLAAGKTHLDELLSHIEAGKILLDDEGRNALGTQLRRGLGVNQQHVGHRAVGDVDLGAVEDVVVALAARASAHRAQRIRAGAGFGQAERADFCAVAQIGQVLAALRLVGVAVDVVDAQVVVRRPGQGDGGVPARKGLADQARAEQFHARATMLGRHGGPHEASRSNSLKDIRWPPLLVVHAAREWHEFLARELVGGFEHGTVVGGEGKTARRGHKGCLSMRGLRARCHGARPSCGDEVSLGLREFNEGLPNCQALGRIRCRRSPEVPEIWRLRPWEAESVRIHWRGPTCCSST